MGSGSRVLQLHCKSFSLFYLFPCLTSTQLRFKSVTTHTPSPTNSRVHRMATEASSSPSSVTSAKEIAELWMEYEENSSPEAKIVKDFDKVEMILQALEYENGSIATGGGGCCCGASLLAPQHDLPAPQQQPPPLVAIVPGQWEPIAPH